MDQKHVLLISVMIILYIPIALAEMPVSGMESFIGTFSIVACDQDLKEFGVAVTSKFLAVGSVVPFVSADSGAIATQAWGNTDYGVRGLKMLGLGVRSGMAVELLTKSDPLSEYRQLGIVDANGVPAAFTGAMCQNWAGHKTGLNYTVQGNILTGPEVLDAMATAFETTEGTLAERMLAALDAGQKAGGDSRGKQSAALRLARTDGGYSGGNDVAIDLRVDDHPEPLLELRRLLKLHDATFGLLSYVQSASAFRQSGEIAAAESCLKRALKMAEDQETIEPAWLNAVAWALVESNQELDRALSLAERALKADSENAAIIDTVATIHWTKGNLEKALELQEKAVAIEPENLELREKLDLWRNSKKEMQTHRPG